MRSSNLLSNLCAALGTVLAACGGSGDSGAPPSNLHYSKPAAVYARGVEIEPNQASVKGKVSAFWVEPTLPTGLALDPKTGAITGAPEDVADLGAFTVFAKNAYGKTQTTLQLGVVLPTRFAIVGHVADQTLGVYTLDPSSGEWRPRGFRARTPAELDLRAIVGHPNGRFVYVVDETSNDLALYTLESTTGELVPAGVFPTGAAPYALVFDADGCHGYVLCRLDATVETYSIDAVTGAPTRIDPPVALEGGPQAMRLHPSGQWLYVAETGQSRLQALVIDPVTHTPSLHGASRASGQTPVDLELDPSGRFLYTSNLRGHNLSMFEIAADGQPLPKFTLAAGIFPSDVEIDPTGRFLYVCESGNDTVRGFAIDAATGELMALDDGKTVGVRPIALCFESTGSHLYALDIDGNRSWNFPVDPETGALGTPRETFTRELPMCVAMIEGQNAATPRSRFAYVANGGSQDVSVYAANPDSGVLTSITPSVFDQGSPRVALAAPTGRFVCTLNAGTNDAHVFTVDGAGDLSPLGAPTALSGTPTAGVFDASGRFAFALIGAGDRIDTLELDPATGALTALGSTATDAGPAALAVDPTGRFLYVANYAANTITWSRIDPHTGALTPASSASVVPGQPRSLVCHPDGRHLYAVLEAFSTAVKFDIDPYTGELSSPEAQSTGALPTSIALDARGRFAYTANASVGGGELGVFRIEPATGDLLPLGTALSGLGPIALIGDPSGRFLYSVNQDDDTVSIYGIHQATGMLTIGVSVGTGVAPRSIAILGSLE